MASMVVIFDDCCSLLLVIPFLLGIEDAGILKVVELSCTTVRYCRLLSFVVVEFFRLDWLADDANSRARSPVCAAEVDVTSCSVSS